MLFGTWLQSARARERESGVDHRELACYAGKLTPYVQDQMSRALHDLEKLYIRIPPTALHESNQRLLWESLRTDFVRDIRGALDHIGAVLTAVGCTEEELEDILGGATDAEVGEESGTNEESANSGSGETSPEEETIVMSATDIAIVTGHGIEK